jgi:hypothetical protein
MHVLITKHSDVFEKPLLQWKSITITIAIIIIIIIIKLT